MAAQQSNTILKSFPGWRRAELSLILSNSLVAALLAASGLAFLLGPIALHRWYSLRLGQILYVLPGPDLVFSFISITSGSPRSAYMLVGIIDLFLAGLMVVLAIGIGKFQRWAYWAFSLVCLSGIVGRTLAIWHFSVPNRFSPLPSVRRYVLLDSIGIVVAFAAAWYSHHRASSLSDRQAYSAKKSESLFGFVPWATVVVAALALSFNFIRAAYLFHRIDSWQVRYESLRFILVVLAYASILVLGYFRPTRGFAASLALGIAVMSLLTFNLGSHASPDSFLVLLLGLSAGASRQPESFVLAGFVLSNLVLVFVSLASVIRSRSFHVGFVALAAIFVGAIDPALHALQEHDASRYSLAQELGKGGPYILFRTESCLVRFKAEHSATGFPNSLLQLDKSLPGCLQSGLATDREIGGYRIEYHVSSTAPIEHFSLIAIPAVHYTGLMISFFSDETGVTRTYRGNRLAAASDGGVTPAEDLLWIRNCVLNFTSLSDKQIRGWPEENRAYDADQLRYPFSFNDMTPENRCFLKGQRDGDSWTTAAYRFSYRKLAHDGIENFALLARPIQYGSSGLRSYFLDNTFIIHATSENRDATADDPWAYSCEFTSLGTPCVDMKPKTRPASEDDLPKDDPRYAQEQPRSHGGGLAFTGAAELFWHFNNTYIWFVGVSADLQRVFMKVSDKGIIAISQDGRPLWIYEGAKSALAAGNSLYAVNDDGILSRIDANGKILWSFNYLFNGASIRSSEGVIFAFGRNGLYAIAENGEMLWRVLLPDYGGFTAVLRDDEKVLYAVSDRKLHAVDIRKRKLLWSADNACYSAGDLCRPQLLADGSITIISNDVKGREHKDFLRLLDAAGKTVWTIEYPHPIEYVVPSHTNTIVISGEAALQALNTRGAAEWNLPPRWESLSESHRPGFFYACFNALETLVDVQGQRKFIVPAEKVLAGPCGSVREASDDLLFIEARPQLSLWTVRLPDSVSTAHIRATH